MADKEHLPTKDVALVTLGGVKIKTADEIRGTQSVDANTAA